MSEREFEASIVIFALFVLMSLLVMVAPYEGDDE